MPFLFYLTSHPSMVVWFYRYTERQSISSIGTSPAQNERLIICHIRYSTLWQLFFNHLFPPLPTCTKYCQGTRILSIKNEIFSDSREKWHDCICYPWDLTYLLKYTFFISFRDEGRDGNVRGPQMVNLSKKSLARPKKTWINQGQIFPSMKITLIGNGNNFSISKSIGLITLKLPTINGTAGSMKKYQLKKKIVTGTWGVTGILFRYCLLS